MLFKLYSSLPDQTRNWCFEMFFCKQWPSAARPGMCYFFVIYTFLLHNFTSSAGPRHVFKNALGSNLVPQDQFCLCNGIRWPLFSYLHYNSQFLIIIFVHWTQLLEYWIHVTNYTLWIILSLKLINYLPCWDLNPGPPW